MVDGQVKIKLELAGFVELPTDCPPFFPQPVEQVVKNLEPRSLYLLTTRGMSPAGAKRLTKTLSESISQRWPDQDEQPTVVIVSCEWSSELIDLAKPNVNETASEAETILALSILRTLRSDPSMASRIDEVCSRIEGVPTSAP